MSFINLTPHAININGVIYEPSGYLARVEVEEHFCYVLGDGTRVNSRKLGSVSGMDGFGDDALFLVSSMVLEALSPTSSLAFRTYAPDTGESAIRNSKGQIEMVTQLVVKHIPLKY